MINKRSELVDKLQKDNDIEDSQFNLEQGDQSDPHKTANWAQDSLIINKQVQEKLPNANDILPGGNVKSRPPKSALPIQFIEIPKFGIGQKRMRQELLHIKKSTQQTSNLQNKDKKASPSPPHNANSDSQNSNYNNNGKSSKNENPIYAGFQQLKDIFNYDNKNLVYIQYHYQLVKSMSADLESPEQLQNSFNLVNIDLKQLIGGNSEYGNNGYFPSSTTHTDHQDTQPNNLGSNVNTQLSNFPKDLSPEKQDIVNSLFGNNLTPTSGIRNQHFSQSLPPISQSSMGIQSEIIPKDQSQNQGVTAGAALATDKPNFAYNSHYPEQFPLNTLKFQSRFESGNLSMAVKVSDTQYNLLQQNDINTKGYTQWFYYRVTQTKKHQQVKFNILNFSKSNSLFNEGMKIVIYSRKKFESENIGWHRDGQDILYFRNAFERPNSKFSQTTRYYHTLTFAYTFPYDQDEVFFAYNYPYTYTDLGHYLSEIQSDQQKGQFLSRRSLCTTLAGNQQLLQASQKRNDQEGVDDGKDSNFEEKELEKNQQKGVFLSARVHPGETVSSFIMKGVIDYLTSDRKEAHLLRQRFIFKLIPMLNPDGVIHGNYRSSLSGCDLNRRWQNPSKLIHREIYETKNQILSFAKNTEMILFCDFHGHSIQKNIFVYGCHDQYQPLACRELPFLISRLSPAFSFSDCNFIVQKDQQGTARIALWQGLKIPNIFTMESSFCGPSYENIHFTMEDLQNIGHKFCQALLIYFDSSDCDLDLEPKLQGRQKIKSPNIPGQESPQASPSTNQQDYFQFDQGQKHLKTEKEPKLQNQGNQQEKEVSADAKGTEILKENVSNGQCDPSDGDNEYDSVNEDEEDQNQRIREKFIQEDANHYLNRNQTEFNGFSRQFAEEMILKGYRSLKDFQHDVMQELQDNHLKLIQTGLRVEEQAGSDSSPSDDNLEQEKMNQLLPKQAWLLVNPRHVEKPKPQPPQVFYQKIDRVPHIPGVVIKPEYRPTRRQIIAEREMKKNSLSGSPVPIKDFNIFGKDDNFRRRAAQINQKVESKVDQTMPTSVILDQIKEERKQNGNQQEGYHLKASTFVINSPFVFDKSKNGEYNHVEADNICYQMSGGGIKMQKSGLSSQVGNIQNPSNNESAGQSKQAIDQSFKRPFENIFSNNNSAKFQVLNYKYIQNPSKRNKSNDQYISINDQLLEKAVFDSFDQQKQFNTLNQEEENTILGIEDLRQSIEFSSIKEQQRSFQLQKGNQYVSISSQQDKDYPTITPNSKNNQRYSRENGNNITQGQNIKQQQTEPTIEGQVRRKQPDVSPEQRETINEKLITSSKSPITPSISTKNDQLPAIQTPLRANNHNNLQPQNISNTLSMSIQKNFDHKLNQNTFNPAENNEFSVIPPPPHHTPNSYRQAQIGSSIYIQFNPNYYQVNNNQNNNKIVLTKDQPGGTTGGVTIFTNSTNQSTINSHHLNAPTVPVQQTNNNRGFKSDSKNLPQLDEPNINHRRRTVTLNSNNNINSTFSGLSSPQQSQNDSKQEIHCKSEKTKDLEQSSTTIVHTNQGLNQNYLNTSSEKNNQFNILKKPSVVSVVVQTEANTIQSETDIGQGKVYPFQPMKTRKNSNSVDNSKQFVNQYASALYEQSEYGRQQKQQKLLEQIMEVEDPNGGKEMQSQSSFYKQQIEMLQQKIVQSIRQERQAKKKNANAHNNNFNVKHASFYIDKKEKEHSNQ